MEFKSNRESACGFVRPYTPAGSTFHEALDQEVPPKHSWSPCDHEIFKLRSGTNYAKNAQKASSSVPILDLVAVDLIGCASRIDNIANLMSLNPEWSTTAHANHLGIPSIFVVNVQIPQDFSPNFFSSVDNGPGWTLVMFFRLTEHSAAVLNSLAAGGDGEVEGYSEDLRRNIPAIKLFANYCLTSTDGPGDSAASRADAMRGRFKVVVHCGNLDSFGLPSFITSYNAKPVLIRQTGTFIRGGNYIEMDINIHKFGNLPKKALEILISEFENMHINIGFCIESRTDTEMPETLLGCCSLHQPTPQMAPLWTEGRE